jgi:hypothetical protein
MLQHLVWYWDHSTVGGGAAEEGEEHRGDGDDASAEDHADESGNDWLVSGQQRRRDHEAECAACHVPDRKDRHDGRCCEPVLTAYASGIVESAPPRRGVGSGAVAIDVHAAVGGPEEA